MILVCGHFPQFRISFLILVRAYGFPSLSIATVINTRLLIIDYAKVYTVFLKIRFISCVIKVEERSFPDLIIQNKLETKSSSRSTAWKGTHRHASPCGKLGISVVAGAGKGPAAPTGSRRMLLFYVENKQTRTYPPNKGDETGAASLPQQRAVQARTAVPAFNSHRACLPD